MDEDIVTMYNRWENLVLDSAMKTIGKKTVITNGWRKSKSWWNSKVEREVTKRSKMNQEYRYIRRQMERGQDDDCMGFQQIIEAKSL